MHLALLALSFQLGLAPHPVAQSQGRVSASAADSVRDLRAARSAQGSFERSRRYSRCLNGPNRGPTAVHLEVR